MTIHGNNISMQTRDEMGEFHAVPVNLWEAFRELAPVVIERHGHPTVEFSLFRWNKSSTAIKAQLYALVKAMLAAGVLDMIAMEKSMTEDTLWCWVRSREEIREAKEIAKSQPYGGKFGYRTLPDGSSILVEVGS